MRERMKLASRAAVVAKDPLASYAEGYKQILPDLVQGGRGEGAAKQFDPRPSEKAANDLAD